MQRRDCAIDAAKRLGANACAKRGLHASFGGGGAIEETYSRSRPRHHRFLDNDRRGKGDIGSDDIAPVEALADQWIGNPIAKPATGQLSSITNQHRDQCGWPMSMPDLCFRRSWPVQSSECGWKIDECIQSIPEARRLLRI
jgi:hypothetical protein